MPDLPPLLAGERNVTARLGISQLWPVVSGRDVVASFLATLPHLARERPLVPRRCGPLLTFASVPQICDDVVTLRLFRFRLTLSGYGATLKDMTTKHSCGGPVFGKKTPGCPRCDELLSGAKPVQWNSRKADDLRRSAEIHAHFASAEHRSGRCGLVCTYGEW